MKEKLSIICFGFMPWSAMWKRNQSMFAELSAYELIDRAVFVNPAVWLKDIFRIGAKVRTDLPGRLAPVKRLQKVWSYTPLILPFRHRFKMAREMEKRIMIGVIERLAGGNPHILLLNCPNTAIPEVVEHFLDNARMSIFDLSDDFMELIHSESGKEFYRGNMERFIPRMDMVLSVNEHVRDKYLHLNGEIHIVPNATNYENFANAAPREVAALERLKSGNRYLVGYHGWIYKSRVDFALLDRLIAECPECEFVFVGPADEAFNQRYRSCNRLHLFPAVDYGVLPSYIRYFDLAIIPFKVNEHTRGNDLLKFYDYLSMGKRVVSTDVAGAGKLRDVIGVASDHSQFIEMVKSSLAGDSTQGMMKRQEVARQNSWKVRTAEVMRMIDRGLTGCGGNSAFGL